MRITQKKRQAKVISQISIFGTAAIALLLTSTSPLLAQAGRPASPAQPPTNQPEATGATQSIVPAGNDPYRRTNPTGPVPAASLLVRLPATLESLKENLSELQELTTKLRQAIKPAASPDYDALVTNSARIQRLAKCLQSTTGLRPSSSRDSRPPQSKTVEDGNLRQLVSEIDQALKKFMNSPVAQRSRTINADDMAEAGAELEKIIMLSAELQTQAQVLGVRVERNQSVGSAARPKHSYKRLPYLQLTIDCSVWSAALFSHRPAAVKKDSHLKVEGVEVQVMHHRLTERQLVSLEQCMPCSFDEKAVAEGERYAVLLKDFYSYEAKGRTFAYHVSYEVVRTKNGKITSRLVQPVILFFVDTDGQGEFELAQSNRPLTSLPEWIRELFPQRWVAAPPRG